MYCRMCGNKISDTDQYCQMCGTPTGLETQSAAPSETAEEKEEIVFNPPFENLKFYFAEKDLRYAEEESSETEEDAASPEKEEADLKEFISENEIKEANQRKAESDRREGAGEAKPVKAPEFSWNVHDFPRPGRKTEEIEFNWNMEEFSPSEQIETESPSFEEELFREIADDTNRGKEQNIDRFFTFSKKNEEFQELLDKEYEKLTMHAGPEARVMGPGSISPEPESISTEAREPETIPTEPPLEAAVSLAAEPAPSSETGASEAKNFGDDLIRDNESIKRKLESPEAKEELTETEPPEPFQPAVAVEQPEPETAELKNTEQIEPETAELKNTEQIEPETAESEDFEPAAADPEIVEPAEAEKPEAAAESESDEMMFMPAMPAFSLGDDEKEKHRWGVGHVLLVILAVILAIEIAILGIRYFAPDSGAAKAVNAAQTQVFHTVSGWADGIKGMFSGKDANKDTTAPKNSGGDSENTGQGNGSSGQSGDNAQTTSTGAVSQKPDPSPAADKNALVSSQLGNNKNIEQVKAGDSLTYQAGKDYGSKDINNSKPIENNVWNQPENGEPVYYDRSVVGTVIAFDSQWIDYVNGGGKSVFDLVKKDSGAYRKLTAFSKAGKVKETFKLLEIGEIRQGEKGFYVWTHEEIQVTEKGKTTNSKYNWIYYLEPSEGKMQIVNYFKFQ